MSKSRSPISTGDSFATSIVRISEVQMEQYHNRLDTFKTWPKNHHLNPTDLAQCGFYYTGSEDRVKCAFCLKKLKNWKQEDVISEEHLRVSPTCPKALQLTPSDNVSESVQENLAVAQSGLSPLHYRSNYSEEPWDEQYPSNATLIEQSLYIIRSNASVMQLRAICDHLRILEDAPPRLEVEREFYLTALQRHTNNLTLPQLINVMEALDLTNIHETLIQLQREKFLQQSSTSERPSSPKAAFPEYHNYDTRVESFLYSPWGEKEDKYRFAEAGFYYYGISDCLRCFWCGGGLQDWKSGETPYHEHARWFPSCEFLVQQKGQSYVENVLQCEEDRQAGHQVHSQVEDLRQQPVATPITQEEVGTWTECVICMDRLPEVVILNCGHLCCCEICVKSVELCPICRCHMERYVKVYRS